jgi:hypothetical protein
MRSMSMEMAARPDDPTPPSDEPGKEPVRDFFETHRDFFAAYAGDSSIRVEKSPPGLGTFAIDLEKGVLYGEPKFFTERGYSEAKAFFAFLHEFEHFRELRDLMKEDGGSEMWEKHRARLKASKRLALLDNCWDDVRMNRSVVSRAPVQEGTKDDLYKENLFADQDFLKLPKHLQFAYALLREKMLPDEVCYVAPDVRAELERLRSVKSRSGVSLLDYASRPGIPPSLRIKLQRKHLEPAYEKFFREDVEEKKKEGEGEKGEGGEPGEPKSPEDFFKDEYQEYFDQSPDAAMPEEAMEAAAQAVVDKAAKEGKSVKDMLGEGGKKLKSGDAIETAAREGGVTAPDLRAYAGFWSDLEDIRNPETDERVIDDLRSLFRRIVTERTKKRLRSKQPVSEGEVLVRPAEAVAAVKAGIEEPEVWATMETKERPEKEFGDLDVTLVFDRSGSMKDKDRNGAVKKDEQRKAGVLLLEALKEFAEEVDDVRADMTEDIHVRTEARSFGSKKENEILKPLSEEMSDEQRVAVYKKLSDTPGDSTMDFLSLEDLAEAIGDEEEEKMKAKKLRKLIFVLSDGDSNDAVRVQKTIEKIRAKGAKVFGIGVTEGGRAVESTYSPEGRVCERAADLAVVMAELLKKELGGV